MTKIVFTYGAVENLNTGQGFLPYVTEDGMPMLCTRANYGHKKEVALAIAFEKAHQFAARFAGNHGFNIRVSPAQKTDRVYSWELDSAKLAVISENMIRACRGAMRESLGNWRRDSVPFTVYDPYQRILE